MLVKRAIWKMPYWKCENIDILVRSASEHFAGHLDVMRTYEFWLAKMRRTKKQNAHDHFIM